MLFNPGFQILFPGLKLLPATLPMNYWFPFWREFVMFLGASTCEKNAVEARLAQGGKGSTMFLAVGSAEEFRYMKAHVMRLVLNKRKGFVKLALRTGANLVPVLGFGENESAVTLEHPIFNPLHQLFKLIFSTSAPIFIGGNFGLPTKYPLITLGK
jgi:2-acylglycerol O-acyltransferase 2